MFFRNKKLRAQSENLNVWHLGPEGASLQPIEGSGLTTSRCRSCRAGLA